MKKILSVEKIEKYYGNKGNVTKAIDNISFRVAEGEFVGIMGPSGSGKTTLLNCISTIDTVTTGSIIINDKDIIRLKSKSLDKFRQNELGFVFQDFNLLDTLTAYENIALALTIKGEKTSNIDEKIKSVAKYLEIDEILSKYPYQMSGGQKQRVASARAIVTDPSLNAFFTASSFILILKLSSSRILSLASNKSFGVLPLPSIAFMLVSKSFNELSIEFISFTISEVCLSIFSFSFSNLL